MEGKLGPYTVKETPVYNLSGDQLKTLIGVLEEGLETTDSGRIVYDAKKRVSLRDLLKRLDGKVAPQLVDNTLDILVDSKILGTGMYPVKKPSKGDYDRMYGVRKASVGNVLTLFVSTHDFYKGSNPVNLDSLI